MAEVHKFRTLLHKKSIEGSRDVCGKTVESQTGLVLAAQNVNLYFLSFKFRGYALKMLCPMH